MQTFYTTIGLDKYVGTVDIRAWLLKKGKTAPVAAGVLDLDFKKGFRAAYVVNYRDILNPNKTDGSLLPKIKYATEKKDYVV